jgi:hypothetical protein
VFIVSTATLLPQVTVTCKASANSGLVNIFLEARWGYFEVISGITASLKTTVVQKLFKQPTNYSD